MQATKSGKGFAFTVEYLNDAVPLMPRLRRKAPSTPPLSMGSRKDSILSADDAGDTTQDDSVGPRFDVRTNKAGSRYSSRERSVGRYRETASLQHFHMTTWKEGPVYLTDWN